MTCARCHGEMEGARPAGPIAPARHHSFSRKLRQKVEIDAARSQHICTVPW